MQPAQRPTLAQNGAFLNNRMIGVTALAGDLNPLIHADQQIGPFGPVRQGIAPCFMWAISLVRPPNRPVAAGAHRIPTQ